ncbi:MAG: c-type cytochrome [Planctomycetes bacterium]|nr:c-type cytochrome [Planctomycetota bacterium]
MRWRLSPIVLLVMPAAGALALSGCTRDDRGEKAAPPPAAGAPPAAAGGVAEPPVWRVEPTSVLPSSPELLELGKQVFAKHCAGCHGKDGRGDGLAAYLLYPRPRDFFAARHRLVSTWEGVPTDEDLFRTISRGMPGSAMPAWAQFPERTRWALVHHVKSLAETPLAYGAPTADDPKQGIVPVPAEPAYDEAARARAAQVYEKSCAPCHGATGKGDGVQKQIDTEGFPTRPRDLTLGVFKGNPKAEDVYRRIVAGMPGTPMPSSAYLHGEEAWHLVHLILGMSSPLQRERVEMKKLQIVARRVRSLPQHPEAGEWGKVPNVNLHLMPLWWRAQRPEEVAVQALHDGKEIAVLLQWVDETHDHTAMRPQDFRDAVAIEVSPTAEPPFFAMGGATEPVNIWMWKSERQADLEPAFQDLEKLYPNIGIDAYPNLTLSPLEQPLRHALTLQSDPTFVTGWGAGNIVSDPTRKSPAEDLTANGFGTLRARPKVDQQVEATGVYSTGTYHVLFRRSLQGQGPDGVTLRPGTTVPIAFAVWNGSAGDRDGKKSVTIWQDFRLE